MDGSPNSIDVERECYNPIIKELGINEILGANINEKISVFPWINKERAYVQLITKLLDVEFDSIWKRHKRQLKNLYSLCCLCVLSILCTLLLVRYISLPVDVNLRVNEITPYIKSLPNTKKTIVNLYLGEDVKSDTIYSFFNSAIFKNVPHRFLGEKVRVSIYRADYYSVDTILVLRRDLNVGLSRNEAYYGSIRFKLYHPDKLISNCKIKIGDVETISDINGYVSVDIPLKEQQPFYKVESELTLADTIIYMPCNVYSAIEVIK